MKPVRRLNADAKLNLIYNYPFGTSLAYLLFNEQKSVEEKRMSTVRCMCRQDEV